MVRIRILALLLFASAIPVGAQTVREDMVVSTGWLDANRSSVRLIEIGDRTMYERGHLPGAVLVETSSIVAQLEETPNELPPIAQLQSVFANAGIDRNHRVVLYSEDPIPAARAWFTLDYLGWGQRASILDGGKARWVAEQRALSTGPVTTKRSAFEAIPHEETVTRFRAVREAVRLRDLVEPNLVLIDARPPTQFCGDEAGADVPRPGHIPGAVNHPWSLNLTTNATPVLRPAADLRALYEQAGVGKATRNIVYCRTGMQASVDYFVLKYLGYDASLYDGSFIEWSRSAELIE